MPAFSFGCIDRIGTTQSADVGQQVMTAVENINNNNEDLALIDWGIERFTEKCVELGTTDYDNVVIANQPTENACDMTMVNLLAKWR